MKPMLNVMDNWEESIIRQPGSLCGYENSPVRFNIPKEALKMKGDQPRLPGFPRSAPQMAGSMFNIRKSVRDLDKNPQDGKKQIDSQTLNDLHKFANSAGVDKIGFVSVPREWVFQDTAIRYDKATVLDNAKCFPYFVKYHGCSVCIKVCPFNQQDYAKIKKDFLREK